MVFYRRNALQSEQAEAAKRVDSGKSLFADTFARLRPLAVAVGFNFFVTLAAFPAVVSALLLVSSLLCLAARGWLVGVDTGGAAGKIGRVGRSEEGVPSQSKLLQRPLQRAHRVCAAAAAQTADISSYTWGGSERGSELWIGVYCFLVFNAGDWSGRVLAGWAASAYARRTGQALVAGPLLYAAIGERRWQRCEHTAPELVATFQ